MKEKTVTLTEEQVKAITHALKIAKFKRMPLTIGNVFSLVEPGLRDYLRREYREILGMTITGVDFEKIAPKQKKKKK